MRYITVEKNIITGIFTGSELPKGAIEITEKSQYAKGSNIGEYDSEGVKLSLSQLVKKGLFVIPNGQKIVGDELADMTLSEKLEAGLITIGDDEVIKEVDGVEVIQLKTLLDRWLNNEYTEEEFNQIVANEVRNECNQYIKQYMPDYLRLKTLQEMNLISDAETNLIAELESYFSYLRVGIMQQSGYPHNHWSLAPHAQNRVKDFHLKDSL